MKNSARAPAGSRSTSNGQLAWPKGIVRTVTAPVDDLAFQTLVDDSLAVFVDDRRRQLHDMGPDIDAFIDVAADFVAGGKRLRPAFCHAGWCAAGAEPGDERIAWAAAAFEWLQGSALVHDDLMDGSDTRRGKPSAHRAFEGTHRDEDAAGDAETFGRAAAILLGDLMLSWTDAMVRTSGFDVAAIERAMPYLDACKTEVVAGQFLDVRGQTKAHTSVEDAMRIVRYKSAKYTVERPLHVGAALAGAAKPTMDALSAFAIPLGEAFQLRDDILGIFGDPATTGKPAGDDLREGKRTVLIARTYELSDEDGRALLREGLGDNGHVAALTALIGSSGALKAVEQQIADLETTAERALEALPAAQDQLRELLRRSTRRSR